jgi:Icc-related predicted phosphoesterase
MKILAIGDFHGKFPAKLKKLAKESDLVISTGDFGGSDKLLKVIFKYWRQDWWEIVGKRKAKKYIMEDYNSGNKMINDLDKLGTPVYTIAGNWDFDKTSKSERTAKYKLKKIEEIIKKKKNISFIHRTKRNFNGLKVFGFGGRIVPYIYISKEGSPKKDKRDEYKKEYQKLTKQMFKNPIKNLDIFVGHYTPYGYFDKVKFPGENPMNGKHVGFKQYTDYIKKYKPKLFICGHMHEYQGKKKLGDTLIVTTGAAKEGKAAIIYFDEKKGKVKSVKFVR